MSTEITLSLGALGLAGAGFVASVVLGAREFVLWLSGRRWTRWAAFHRKAIEGLREDLAELYRRTHYRYNVRCPQCGKLSAQAEGYPPGVADCKIHGLGVSPSPETASIPVVIVEVPEVVGEIFPEPPPLELEEPPKDFTELETGPLPILEEVK